MSTAYRNLEAVFDYLKKLQVCVWYCGGVCVWGGGARMHTHAHKCASDMGCAVLGSQLSSVITHTPADR